MIKALQEKIKASNLDAVLIVSPENRFYFTSFASSDGYLLVSPERAIFITDGRYIEAAQSKVKNCEVVLQGRTFTQIEDFFMEMGAKNIGIEASRLTVQELVDFQNALQDFTLIFTEETDDIITELRMVKSQAEIENMIAAQRIAEAALEHIFEFIHPGVTEKQIALELDFYMLSHGAEALSFETIAASGKNSSMPHAVPTDKKIEKGDFVTMDFGAVVNGYHSDMTRTIAVGSVSEKQKEVYETVLAAQRAGLAALKPGLARHDGDKITRQVIENAGYGDYFSHSTGHGVGVEIHEMPYLTPRETEISALPLAVGNVVTVEPGIYLPGEFGVRIEDFAVITKDGSLNMTKAPKELIIL